MPALWATLRTGRKLNLFLDGSRVCSFQPVVPGYAGRVQKRTEFHVRLRGVGVGIGLLSLVVQAVYGWAYWEHVLGHYPILTAEGYDAWARQWIYGNGLNPGLFSQSFGYHLLVSGLYFISDSSTWLVYGFQAFAVAVAGSALSVWAMTRISSRWGWLAGAVTVLYGPLVFHAFLVGPGVWACVGAIGLIWMFDRAVAEDSPRAWRRLGVSIIVAGTLHPALLAGGLGGLIALGLSRIGHATTRLTFGFLLHGLLGGAVVAVPLTLVTYGQTRVMSFLPLSDGLSLWLPNHGGDCDQTYPQSVLQMERVTREARRQGAVTPRDQRHYFWTEAGQSWRNEPGVWLSAMGEKFLQLLGGREPGGELSPAVAHGYSRLQRWLFWTRGLFGFPWGLLLPLAMAGWFWGWRSIPVWMWGLLGGYVAAGVVFSVTTPYRLGLLPVVALGVVCAIQGWDQRLRAHAYGKAVMALGAVAVMMGVLSLPGPFCSERGSHESIWRIAVAQRALMRGDLELSRNLLDEALSYEPDHPVGLNGRANVALALADDETAEIYLRKALAIAPDYALAWFNLALIERERNRTPEALEALFRGLSYQPWRGQAHYDAGRLLAAAGDMERARWHLQRALALDPHVTDVLAELVENELVLGLTDVAAARLESARTLVMSDARLAALYGHAALRQDRWHDASGAFWVAQELRPDLPLARAGEVLLALAQDDLPRATAHYRLLMNDAPDIAERWIPPDAQAALTAGATDAAR